MSRIVYDHPGPRVKHKCAAPSRTLELKSLAQCDTCGRYLVVGWVWEGLAYVPGWKRLRWWHVPSQLRLLGIRKQVCQRG